MERLNRIVNHIDAGTPGHDQAPVRSPTPEPASNQNKKFTVTIVGGGNSGHVCAALFHENMKGEVCTQLLTTRPEAWKSDPIVRFPNGAVQKGKLDKISDNPAELLKHSDVVIWTGPVHATKECFENLRPYIKPGTVIGTIFAQGLIHLLAHRTFGSEVRFFALRNIPWLCRTVKIGEESQIVGPKSSIGVMCMNIDDAWVKQRLEPLFVVQNAKGQWEPKIEVLPDFCPIVFNPANQIIHPARYWAMFRSWTGTPLAGDKEPSEWLYRGMDEVAGEVLQVLDEELQGLKNAYYQATGAPGCHEVIPLRDRLLAQYGDQIKDSSTIAKMVGTNQAYSAAKTPFIRTNLGVMPAKDHRVVHDDIGWGLCALVSIAERLEAAGIPTPTTMMRMLIEWHQNMMGKEFLYNGKLRGRDCSELVLLRSNDDLQLVAKPPQGKKEWLSRLEEESEEHRIGNP